MKRHTLRRRYGRAMVDAKSMARDLHAAGSLAVHDPRTGSSFTITTFGRQAGKRGYSVVEGGVVRVHGRLMSAAQLHDWLSKLEWAS